jgi:hypothetical protein
MSALPPIVDANVEHPEPRVRSLVARTVGSHALYATSLLDRRDVVVVGGTTTESSSSSSLARATIDVQDGRRRIHSAILRSLRHHLLMKEPVRENNASRASDGALDDTTGWRALETNLNALASYVDGCVGGTWFLPGLRECCVSHVNRHVRAAGAASSAPSSSRARGRRTPPAGGPSSWGGATTAIIRFLRSGK